MPGNVVELRGVTRRFQHTVALDDIELQVPQGCVFGLVGANGAGKTTLIKHILGLLRAKSGSVRVFGLDPVRNPVTVLRRIGYLSEERELPEWMRIDELLRYTRAFHPNWDPAYGDELLRNFGLDPSKRVKELSKGMRAQTGLIAAVAHRPDLLVLDEPSTGLDPVVRQDILNAIVRTVADEGRTVIFSSHFLDEVERMSDSVAMIHAGRIVVCGTIDAIKQDHHVIEVRFRQTPDKRPHFEGLLSAESKAANWNLVCNGELGRIHKSLETLGGEISLSRAATLQDIFMARVGRDGVALTEAQPG